MGATLTADTRSIPTGYDTSNPIGLLAVTRTAPAIRRRVETPPSHRQTRSEQRNEQNPGHVAMSDAANNNPKPPDSHNRSPTSGGHITWTHNRVPLNHTEPFDFQFRPFAVICWRLHHPRFGGWYLYRGSIGATV